MVQVYQFPENLVVETKDKSTWQELYAAHQNNMILKGLISGLEEYNFKDKKGIAMIVMFENGIKGIIPHFESGFPELDDLAKTLSADTKKVDAYRFTRKRLKSLIGSIEPIKIKEIQQGNNLVYLSRKDALNHLAELMWKKFETNKIVAGNIITGKLRAISSNYVTIDIEGIITFMPLKELSWGFIEDPYHLVELGQPFNIKIKKVDLVKRRLTVSHRECSPNPWPDCLERYLVNNHYMGKVTHVHDKGVFINLEPGVDLFCKHPKFFRPSKGEEVIAKIFGVDKDKKKIWGRIFDKA
jgi:small subunit ribosomal protein S1